MITDRLACPSSASDWDPMKLYGSFLVRCWVIKDASADERAVIDVEHIQSGEHLRVANFAEAEEWVLEACRNAPHTSPAGRRSLPTQEG
jgi:hypothetical protein